MKATEIRVGNWVKEESLGYKQWGLKDFDNYHGEHYPENWISDKIEPIPLTPEILEKAGFEKRVYDAHKKNLIIIEQMPELAAREFCDFKKALMDGDWQIVIQEADIWDVWFGNDEDLDVRLVSIEYLHELQNLFFGLTGDELEINLV